MGEFEKIRKTKIGIKSSKNVKNSWKLDRWCILMPMRFFWNINDKSQNLTLFWHFLWFLKYLNFRALRTLEFFSTRTAFAKKFIFVLLFSKCNYLQLLKKLALNNKFLSRKIYFSDARGQDDPPLVVLGLMLLIQ